MKKFSFVGIILASLYLLLGVLVIYGEMNQSPDSQVGGVAFLIYTLPWSLVASAAIGKTVSLNLFTITIFTALNVALLYVVGAAIGFVLRKIGQVFTGSGSAA